MKYGVNRQILLITAGAVWIIAGANILRIGIVTWLNTSQDWMFKIGEATVVFLLFFVLVFRRLYYKHTQRIEQKKERRNCPFSFFDVKSWITMIFMISLPSSARNVHFCFLYRIIHRPHPDRSAFHPLLVDQAQDFCQLSRLLYIPIKYKHLIIFITRCFEAKDFILFCCIFARLSTNSSRKINKRL